MVSRKLIGHRTGTLDRIVVRQNRDAKNIKQFMTKTLIVKASLFTLILAFMTIGTIVVAAVMKNDIATQTYVFNGIAGEEHMADKYSLSTGTPTNCNGNGVRCEISATPNPANPNWPLLDGTEEVLNQRQ